MKKRRESRRILVGGVAIGGGAPVSVQTMATADPRDAAALAAQAKAVRAAGCDVFRATVPDLQAAKALGQARRESGIPIVADIHFDWRLAIAAADEGADALRLNPGNIGGRDRVRETVACARRHGIPIRIGVNAGSLKKDYAEQVAAGRTTLPEALCASALEHLAILEDEGFRDVAISVKASSVADTVAAYRLVAERTDCPLHLGVTEAGTALPGAVRSAVAAGILLSEGIGDTLRVSLTAPPEAEVRAGLEILRSLGLRPPGPAIVSCPTCGRTKVPLFEVAAEVESRLEALYAERRAAGADLSRFPRVAVMGCVVNGPGEAKGADVALCGGDGCWLLYVKGTPVCKTTAAEAPGKVMEYVVSL